MSEPAKPTRLEDLGHQRAAEADAGAPIGRPCRRRRLEACLRVALTAEEIAD